MQPEQPPHTAEPTLVGRGGKGDPARSRVRAGDVSELHVRIAGVGGDSAGVVELEHGPFHGGGDCADERLGEEEGDEVQEGFWGQISEEAV